MSVHTQDSAKIQGRRMTTFWTAKSNAGYMLAPRCLNLVPTNEVGGQRVAFKVAVVAS